MLQTNTEGYTQFENLDPALQQQLSSALAAASTQQPQTHHAHGTCFLLTHLSVECCLKPRPCPDLLTHKIDDCLGVSGFVPLYKKFCGRPWRNTSTAFTKYLSCFSGSNASQAIITGECRRSAADHCFTTLPADDLRA